MRDARRWLRCGVPLVLVGLSVAVSGRAQPMPPATAAPPVHDPAPAAPAPSAAAAGDGLGLEPYRAALANERLDGVGPLGTEQLGQLIAAAEAHLALGRRDEAIAVLATVVGSARFRPLAELEEGRAATFLLGDALGRAGAYALSRALLERLLAPSKQDGWYRRSVSRLVDLGLESGDPAAFLAVLPRPTAGVAAPWAGDVAYLTGILHERAGNAREALAAYSAVSEQSRFWAQATYRAGLLEVDQGRLGEGERLFCRIADPKLTPKVAPLFGGNDFFQVRDLSRLALGRVAHEQYRFDDARYYYHLVPADSDRLPEALYESATSRYEAKDYRAAHALIGELRALGRHHVYEDEVWILDAYVDLAQCEFPSADEKLAGFLARYEPVLAAARQLKSDPRAVRALLAGQDGTVAKELGGSPDVTELIRTSVRLDASYGRVTRQIADLDHQISGSSAALGEMDRLSAAVVGGDVVARPVQALADSPSDRLQRLDEQTAAVRRLLREAASSGRAPEAELAMIRGELNAVETEALTLRTAERAPRPPANGQAVPELLRRDAALAAELSHAAQGLRDVLSARQEALAVEAVARLELRLARLVRRARAGRIETVLGRKRALELEVEALSQGFLPQGAVDSLDAARYLADDEEYWPFDGEDWEDEYIGGEGLR